jgi:hypothetical protein
VNLAIAITFLSIGMIIGFAVCAMFVAGYDEVGPENRTG